MLVGTGITGVALRVWVYRSSVGTPDGDEGVVGLTARHILHGEFPAFIWGLDYGGTQELFLTAPIFWIFGSSWLALRIVPLGLGAVAALLVWRVGRRTIGEPAATVAGALFWIWPPYVIAKLVHQHGYYGSAVFYTPLILLLALRVVERPSTLRVGLLGFVLGLAFWQSAQLVPIMLPVVAWTIWRQPQSLRKLWAAVPLALLGALPWIVWNAQHDWQSFHLSYGAESTYMHRLRVFVSPLMPMTLGLRQFFTQERVIPAAPGFLILAILAGLFVYGAIRTRRSDVSLLYFVALVFPFVYALSKYTIDSADPHYLVVFMPVLPLLLAQLATTRVRGTVLLTLGALTTFVVLHNAIVQTEPKTHPPVDLRPLISTLDRLDVHYAYGSHWIVYRVAFETKERIIGVKSNWEEVTWDGTQAQVRPPGFVRHAPWERSVREHRHAFIFYTDELPAIAAELRRYGYRTHDVPGSLIVVYALPPE